MNYYPYYNYIPNSFSSYSPKLFSRIFRGGINWGNLINNTQKTLNIINQTIPVVKQVSPVIKNAKTMFKVLNEFKKEEPKQSTIQNIQINKTTELSNYNNFENGPTFFA